MRSAQCGHIFSAGPSIEGAPGCEAFDEILRSCILCILVSLYPVSSLLCILVSLYPVWCMLDPGCWIQSSGIWDLGLGSDTLPSNLRMIWILGCSLGPWPHAAYAAYTAYTPYMAPVQ